VSTTSFNCVATADVIGDMVYQCTTVLSQTCNLPNQIIAIIELWTRAYKVELKQHL